MSAVTMVKALSSEIRAALKNYTLDADRHPPKPVTVYEQFIPRAHMEDERGEYHPLVVVTASLIEDDDDNSYIEASLTFGVYGETSIGGNEPWIDLLNIVETVRLRLLERQVIGGRYRLIKPMVTEIAEVQPAPFFYGHMTARYVMYQPVERGRLR